MISKFRRNTTIKKSQAIYFLPSFLLFLLFSMCKSQNRSTIKIEEIKVFVLNQDKNEYDRKSNIFYSELNFYDKNQKITEKKIIYNKEKTNIYDTILVEKYNYKNGNLINKVSFNDQGNKVEEIDYILNNNGKPDRININTFDKNGEKLLKPNHSFYTLLHYSENVVKKSIYEYDDKLKDYKLSYTSLLTSKNKNFTEEKLFDDKNQVYQIEKISYDKGNNPIRIIQTLRYPSEVTQKFNSKNNVIERSYKADDNFERKCFYEYKYDENDNWIEELEIGNDEKILTRRKLIYY